MSHVILWADQIFGAMSNAKGNAIHLREKKVHLAALMSTRTWTELFPDRVQIVYQMQSFIFIWGSQLFQIIVISFSPQFLINPPSVHESVSESGTDFSV